MYFYIYVPITVKTPIPNPLPGKTLVQVSEESKVQLLNSEWKIVQTWQCRKQKYFETIRKLFDKSPRKFEEVGKNITWFMLSKTRLWRWSQIFKTLILSELFIQTYYGNKKTTIL